MQTILNVIHFLILTINSTILFCFSACVPRGKNTSQVHALSLKIQNESRRRKNTCEQTSLTSEQSDIWMSIQKRHCHNEFFFYCRNINSKMKVEIHKHFHATATFVQTAALSGRLEQNHIYIILFTKINKMPYFWRTFFY